MCFLKGAEMDQERFMVIDNQKGVVIPLQSEKMIAFDRINNTEIENMKDFQMEEKVNKIQMLIKAFVKQSIRDTIKEYNLQLTEELKEYESKESERWERLESADLKRWEKIEEEDSKRWEKLEECNEKYWKELQKEEMEHFENIRREEEKHWKQMESHFKSLDKSIREKQEEGKRKKHSIF